MKVTVDNKDYDTENLNEVANKAVAKLQIILNKEQQLNSDYEDLQIVKDHNLKLLRSELAKDDLAVLPKNEKVKEIK
jgi:endoglucanase Acf2